MFFLIVTALITLVTVNAQKIEHSNKAEAHSQEMQTATGVSVNREARAYDAYLIEKKGLKLNAPKIQMTKKQNAPTDDPIAGEYIARGNSLFFGFQQWDMEILKDETDANKYWIHNIISTDAELEPVYATLIGDNLVLQFGQILYTRTDETNFVIAGFDGRTMDTSGTGRIAVNQAEGKLTMSTGFAANVIGNGSMNIIKPETSAFYKADYLPPRASYAPAEGMLFTLFPTQGTNFYPFMSFLALGREIEWKNYSDAWGGYDSSQWEYSAVVDRTSDGTPILETENSTDFDFKYRLNEVVTYTPILAAKSATNATDEYQLGINDPQGAAPYDKIVYGGADATTFSGGSTVINWTNAILDNGFSTKSFNVSGGGTGYIFGTGMGTTTVYSYFENPHAHLFFEGVNIYVDVLTAPNETQYKLEIYHVDGFDSDGTPILGEFIAESTVRQTNAILPAANSGFGVIPFANFVAKDESGFPMELPYLHVDNHDFIFKFTGFNKQGVELSMFVEDGSRPGDRYYTFYEEQNVEGIQLYPGYNTPAFITLTAPRMPYLAASEYEYNVNNDGGSFDLVLEPFWNNVGTLTDDAVPSWITITAKDDIFDQESGIWESRISFTVSPNPTTGQRVGEIEWYTVGSWIDQEAGEPMFYQTVKTKVIQGEGSSIGNVKGEGFDVVRTMSTFELTYPETATSVTVYNVLGQRVAEYQLTSEGSFSMPTADLNNGVYVLKFNGTNYSVKVLK